MTFNVSVISVNRLFPTKYISTAYGVVNMFAHCFACFSSLVAEIPDPYPFIVFEALIVIAAFATLKIKEVKNLASEEDGEVKEDSIKDSEDHVAYKGKPYL